LIRSLCSLAVGVAILLTLDLSAVARRAGEASSVPGLRLARLIDRPTSRPPTLPADAAAQARAWASGRHIKLVSGPVEAALLEDLGDGNLDRHGLVEACLIASGVVRAEDLQAYLRDYEQLVAAIQRIEPPADPRRRARLVFEVLHAEALAGGYCVDCTDLRGLIDGGHFNCVSSAVLYNALAERFGLTTSAVALPGHAYSIVWIGRQPLEVETTCANWFEVLDDPTRQAELVEQTIGSDHRTDRAADKRIVSNEILVGTIYYNRGVGLLERGAFAESIAVNTHALAIDPAGNSAWANLLATINNWGLDLATDGHYEAGLEMLGEGRALAPDHAIFTSNLAAVYQQWIDALLTDQRSGEAVAVLARASTDWVEPAHFAALRRGLYRRCLTEALIAGRPERAWQLLDQARLQWPTWRQLDAVAAEAVESAAAALAQAGDVDAARAAIESAIDRLPASTIARLQARYSPAQTAAAKAHTDPAAPAQG